MAKNAFAKYQAFVNSTAIYPETSRITYPLIGLMGELGEYAEHIKKHIRDGKPIDRERAKKELGDIGWYLVQSCTDLGFSWSEVVEENVNKLNARKLTGRIGGSGDDR